MRFLRSTCFFVGSNEQSICSKLYGRQLTLSLYCCETHFDGTTNTDCCDKWKLQWSVKNAEHTNTYTCIANMLTTLIWFTLILTLDITSTVCMCLCVLCMHGTYENWEHIERITHAHCESVVKCQNKRERKKIEPNKSHLCMCFFLCEMRLSILDWMT